MQSNVFLNFMKALIPFWNIIIFCYVWVLYYNEHIQGQSIHRVGNKNRSMLYHSAGSIYIHIQEYGYISDNKNMDSGEEKMIQERDSSIDFLRTIGLLCVILAHVNAPQAVMRWRCFDVVLLVFVSGLSYMTSKGNEQDHLHYLKKRICRLVFPTWKFLCIFFGLFGVLHLINPVFPELTLKECCYSFLFISGIGYVWIIMVYLLAAAALPVQQRILDRVGVDRFLCIMAVLYVVYEILIRAGLLCEQMIGGG